MQVDWKTVLQSSLILKIELKSFDERVLIFTTCIENLYIFKVTNHKEDCRHNQSQKFTFEDVNRIQRIRFQIHQSRNTLAT